MIHEYAEFKSISVEELNNRIANSTNLLVEDINKYRNDKR